MKFLILLTITLALASCSSPRVTAFRNLPHDGVINATYESKGCFHHAVYEFEFHSASCLTVKITEIKEPEHDGSGHITGGKRVALGTVNLSRKEATGLDRLLEFYRKRQEGGCTTVDHITISRRAKDGAVTTETFIDETCDTSDRVEFTTFNDLIYRLSSDEPPKKEPRFDLAAARKEAVNDCRRIRGFRKLRGRLEIESAYKGVVNAMPESLNVTLKSTRPALIDDVDWWNPVVAGKPSLSWTDFLVAYNQAETALARHPWLAVWKKKALGRSIDVNLLGTGIGIDENYLKTYLMPVWHHAAMKGVPSYCAHLRWGNHGCVELCFSDLDERAVIIYASPDRPGTPLASPISSVDATMPEVRANQSDSIEELDLCWHFKGTRDDMYSKYAVVDRHGTCKVLIFVASEESHP